MLSKIIPFNPALMITYKRSLVTISLASTVSEINGDFRRKSPNFPTSRVFIAPAEGVSLGIGYRCRGQNKLE